jgi:hypothetical protein
VVSFRQVFQSKPSMYLSCPPYVPHARPISFFSIWSGKKHFVTKAQQHLVYQHEGTATQECGDGTLLVMLSLQHHSPRRSHLSPCRTYESLPKSPTCTSKYLPIWHSLTQHETYSRLAKTQLLSRRPTADTGFPSHYSSCGICGRQTWLRHVSLREHLLPSVNIIPPIPHIILANESIVRYQPYRNAACWIVSQSVGQSVSQSVSQIVSQSVIQTVSQSVR